MNIELRHLRYFVAITEAGNFSRAADKLLISQPALSAQIKLLEKELDAKLFDRVGRRITITEYGELLLTYARKILLEISEAKEAISELQGLVKGKLTIGVVQTVNAYLIPQISSLFLTKYPGIFLTVLELSATEIEAGVADGRLALGISFIPLLSEQIESQSLFSEKLVLAVSQNHKLSGKKSITIESLVKEKLITFPKGFSTRRLIDELFEKASIRPIIAFETNTIGSILTAVGTSNMVTIVPAIALRLKEGKNLCALKIQNAEAKRELGFLWRRGAVKKKSALAFAQLALDLSTNI